MAETEAGTVGNGRGGVSFLILRRLVAGLPGGGLCFGTPCSSSTTSSSCTASAVWDVSSFVRFALCSPRGCSSGLLRFAPVGVMDQSQGDGSTENGKRF